MVILDSDHKAGARRRGARGSGATLVAPGCYLVVEDTALGTRYLPGWGGSLAAVEAWLPDHPEFRARPEPREVPRHGQSRRLPDPPLTVGGSAAPGRIASISSRGTAPTAHTTAT